MMKTRHKVISLLLVLFIGGGIVVYNIVGSLDKIIKVAVETYGSEISQADVSLDKVVLDLENERITLQGFQLGNPEGYLTPYAMKFDQISIQLDIQSLTENTIVINEIKIDQPSISYESKLSGSNIDILLNNVESFAGNSEEKSSGKKLLIEHFYLINGEVSVSHSVLKGKQLTTVLPDIHLQDIGKDKGGATAGEVARKIIAKVRTETISAVSSLHLDKLTDSIKKVGDKLKGLFQ